MSAKIMGLAFELDLPANKMLVLLAMADHAQHDGSRVFPSIGLIAWKTGYSDKQTRRIIHALVKDNILIETRSSKGRYPSEYQINLAAGKRKQPCQIGSVQTMAQPSQNGRDSAKKDLRKDGRVNPPIAMGDKPPIQPSVKANTKNPPIPPTLEKTNGGEDKCKAMILAWHIAKGGDSNLPIDRNMVYRDIASKLIQAGLTPEDVTRFTEAHKLKGMTTFGFHYVGQNLQTWILNNPIRVRADSSRDAFDDAALARSRQARKKHPELAEEWGEDEIIPQHLIEHFDLKKQPFPLPEGVTEEMIEALVKTHRYEEPPDPLSRRF